VAPKTLPKPEQGWSLIILCLWEEEEALKGAQNIVALKTLPKPEQGSNLPTGSNNI
jgi:hypothetical protein